jgi:hypothetical protein
VLQNDVLHTRHVLSVHPVLTSRTDEILLGKKVAKNHIEQKNRRTITSREDSIDINMAFQAEHMTNLLFIIIRNDFFIPSNDLIHPAHGHHDI